MPEKTVRAIQAQLITLCVSLCLHSGLGRADEGSGCPSYGCLPSGTFALSSDVPGTGNEAVGVKWATPLSVPTPTPTPKAVKPSRLGCVTCQEGIVCATHSGYVAVDQLKGKSVWRYDNMTSPSLPVLDIYGDVIGTDGRHLVKIDASGKVQTPVIKIYHNLAPMYSIQLTNDNLFLMTSRVNGILITYAVNGIPEASLTLRDEVERVNGSFFPVAQPVIYGKRAYILMQFQPDTPQPLKAEAMGLQRLYAVDLWARMAERISPVWYVNFERMRCPGEGRHQQPDVTGPANNVLVHNNTAYVSVGRPEADCRRRRGGDGSSSDVTQGMLWAIHDNGTEPEVLFKIPAPVSALSLYDVDLGQGNGPTWDKAMAGFPRRPPGQETATPHTRKSAAAATSAPLLWAATTQQITGYNSRNGSVKCVVDVSKLLNVPQCRITSKVMVTRSKDGKYERLVFAVSESGNLTARNGANSSQSFVVAASMEVGSDDVQLMWKVAALPGTEVVGQIANMLYMPPAAGSRRSTGQGKTTAERKGGNWSPKGGNREGDDLQVLLVATAVNETAQYSLAIGRP